jgi:hypothetical protein
MTSVMPFPVLPAFQMGYPAENHGGFFFADSALFDHEPQRTPRRFRRKCKSRCFHYDTLFCGEGSAMENHTVFSIETMIACIEQHLDGKRSGYKNYG